jgi:hypothetical protein
MVGAFASFGGFAYAAERAEHGLKTVAKVVTVDHAARQNQRSPAADQYGSPPGGGPSPGGGVSGAGGGSPSATPSGELPFTGFPLMLSGAIGLAFFVLGVALHRREARR